MDRALIVVDAQNEWRTEGSDYFLGDLDALAARLKRLIDHCRSEGFRVIFTRHVEEEGETFAEATERSAILSELTPQEADIVITKHRISPFHNTDLDAHLAGVDSVAVAGILTNLCVRSAVEGAYDRDLDVTVVTDCCQAFDEETHSFTLKDLHETRPEVSFVTLDEFLSSRE